jgi:hypothetical protein
LLLLLLLLAVVLAICCWLCWAAPNLQGWFLLLGRCRHLCTSYLLLLLPLLQLPQQLHWQVEPNACSHGLQQLQLA